MPPKRNQAPNRSSKNGINPLILNIGIVVLVAAATFFIVPWLNAPPGKDTNTKNIKLTPTPKILGKQANFEIFDKINFGIFLFFFLFFGLLGKNQMQ